MTPPSALSTPAALSPGASQRRVLIAGGGGYLGPDLTNVMSAPGKGELYVRALLKIGTDVMPNYNMPESEIAALVAYLDYVDQTGNFPEPNARRTWYGSIKIVDESP